MYIYVIPALLILSLFFFKVRSFKVVYLKALMLPAACVLFILCLIFLSDTAVKSAYDGLKLWLDIVFPSLFPFLVASELLNGTGLVRATGVLLEPVMRPLFNVPGCGSFAFLMGITSGYPVGAKITARMYENKLITREEGERLLAFSNNSGPLFIIGAIAVGMFRIHKAGILLLACHVLACITVGILFGLFSRKNTSSPASRQYFARFKKELLSEKKGMGFGNAFGEAIKNSVTTMLMIGGFIIFFSVIISLLLETGVIHRISSVLSPFLVHFGINGEISVSVISGIFEITTGAKMASRSSGASLTQQLAAVSLIVGWGGLSVHSQVMSIVHGTGMRIRTYLLGKSLQGILACIYTVIGIKTAGLFGIMMEKPAFTPLNALHSPVWYDYVLGSISFFMIFLTIFMFLAGILPAIRSLEKLLKICRSSLHR